MRNCDEKLEKEVGVCNIYYFIPVLVIFYSIVNMKYDREKALIAVLLFARG